MVVFVVVLVAVVVVTTIFDSSRLVSFLEVKILHSFVNILLTLLNVVSDMRQNVLYVRGLR